MTEQEKYIEGQKASGIKVGDTVRITRPNEHCEGGSDACGHTQYELDGHKDDEEYTVTKVRNRAVFIQNNHHRKTGGRFCIPYFVLEIIKKADGTLPDAKPITSETGDSTMKTQEIFGVVVTENEKIKDDNGQIESIKKRVIYSKSDLPAYDEANAKIQATLAAGKVTGVKGIKDVAELEVEATRPFCG